MDLPKADGQRKLFLNMDRMRTGLEIPGKEQVVPHDSSEGGEQS